MISYCLSICMSIEYDNFQSYYIGNLSLRWAKRCFEAIRPALERYFPSILHTPCHYLRIQYFVSLIVSRTWHNICMCYSKTTNCVHMCVKLHCLIYLRAVDLSFLGCVNGMLRENFNAVIFSFHQQGRL